MNAKQNARKTKPQPAMKASGGRARNVRFGVLKGSLRYPSDLDAPLPAEILAVFERRRAKSVPATS
jgi:hypothetical protein